jgi:glycosyltransferase involved in cell wall biosynthesis
VYTVAGLAQPSWPGGERWIEEVDASSRVPARHALLREYRLDAAVVRTAAGRDAGAVHILGNPAWLPSAPRNLVVYFHDCHYRVPPRQGSMAAHLLKILAERTTARASLVLTDSAFSAQEISRRTVLGRKRIEVLYPPLPESAWVPDLDPRSLPLPIRHLKAFWLYFGGYHPRKRVDQLLAAYAEVLQTEEPPPLVLTGRLDPSTATLVSALRASTPARPSGVVQTGRLSELELHAAISQCSAVVYTSHYEGFGYPVAQAAALNRPILAAGSSSIPEILSSRRCLYPPSDTMALVGMLRSAARDASHFVDHMKCACTPAATRNRFLALLDESIRRSTPHHRP